MLPTARRMTTSWLGLYERRYSLLQGPGNAQAEPMASLHALRRPAPSLAPPSGTEVTPNQSPGNAARTGRSNLRIHEASHDGYGRKEKVRRHLAQLPRHPVVSVADARLSLSLGRLGHRAHGINESDDSGGRPPPGRQACLRAAYSFYAGAPDGW